MNTMVFADFCSINIFSFCPTPFTTANTNNNNVSRHLDHSRLVAGRISRGHGLLLALGRRGAESALEGTHVGFDSAPLVGHYRLRLAPVLQSDCLFGAVPGVFDVRGQHHRGLRGVPDCAIERVAVARICAARNDDGLASVGKG